VTRSLARPCKESIARTRISPFGFRALKAVVFQVVGGVEEVVMMLFVALVISGHSSVALPLALISSVIGSVKISVNPSSLFQALFVESPRINMGI